MKVHGTPRPGPVHSPKAESGRDAKQADSPVSRAERVELSDEAKALLSANGPEVPDQARIERLKAAIRDGSFAIDFERVADAMLSEEL